MVIFNFRNIVAKAIEILGIVSLVAAVLLFFVSIFNVKNLIFLYPAAGCLINGIFMFGFAYVVEACAIYVEKNLVEDEIEEEEQTE